MSGTFKFVQSDVYNDQGTIETGCVTIAVGARYDESYDGETAETQREKVTRLLNGEQGLTCTYSNCNGESEFGITADGVFWLDGGAHGPAFGGYFSLNCSYADNKEQIDNFMKFMLKAD